MWRSEWEEAAVACSGGRGTTKRSHQVSSRCFRRQTAFFSSRTEFSFFSVAHPPLPLNRYLSPRTQMREVRKDSIRERFIAVCAGGRRREEGGEMGVRPDGRWRVVEEEEGLLMT